MPRGRVPHEACRHTKALNLSTKVTGTLAIGVLTPRPPIPMRVAPGMPLPSLGCLLRLQHGDGDTIWLVCWMDPKIQSYTSMQLKRHQFPFSLYPTPCLKGFPLTQDELRM